jgi:hypothetical protein
MKILDEIGKVCVPVTSRVAKGARMLYGNPMYECGEALHERLTEIATTCKSAFYAPCSEQLGGAVDVCPAFGPAVEFNRWKEAKTQTRIEELEAKIKKLEVKKEEKR